MNQQSHDKITPTADLISYFRIFSDVPYCAEIAEMTDAKKIAEGILKDSFEKSFYLASMAEARYKRIDIQAHKYKNILEVAVGRSPRGLIFTEDPEINYVATDLPDSLANHKLLIEGLMKRHYLKRPNLKFVPANALDFNQLKSAVDLLPKGPVAIISEGFVIYLSDKERLTFLDNVRRLLVERGGCLITSDVIFPPGSSSKSPAGIFDNISKTTGGRDMRDSRFKDIEEAKRFFNDNGFVAEICADKIDITSIKKLNLENDPASQRVSNYPVWVLKAKI